MKQKGIASFFSKPGQGPAKAAQKRKEQEPDTAETTAADGTEVGVLKDGGLNRQGQKEAGTNPETKKLVTASAGRLKRLKKVAEGSGEENLSEVRCAFSMGSAYKRRLSPFQKHVGVGRP